jgi:ureidoglycolate hydrolase
MKSKPLSSDAFSPFGQVDAEIHNKEVRTKTKKQKANQKQLMFFPSGSRSLRRNAEHTPP